MNQQNNIVGELGTSKCHYILLYSPMKLCHALLVHYRLNKRIITVIDKVNSEGCLQLVPSLY